MKRILFIVFTILVISVLFTDISFAAWLATDDFNSYADGDIAGNNGGTNWSSAWANGTGGANWDVQGTTVYEGAKAIGNTAQLSGSIQRDFTAVNSGILKVAMRRSDKTTADLDIRFVDTNCAGGRRGFLTMQSGANGNIVLYDGNQVNPVTVVSNYNINQWYEIHVSFDATAGTAKARLVGDVAWSSNVTWTGTGDIGCLKFTTDGTNPSGNVYFDDVGVGSEPIAGGKARQNMDDSAWFLLLFNVPMPKPIG